MCSKCHQNSKKNKYPQNMCLSTQNNFHMGKHAFYSSHELFSSKKHHLDVFLCPHILNALLWCSTWSACIRKPENQRKLFQTLYFFLIWLVHQKAHYLNLVGKLFWIWGTSTIESSEIHTSFCMHGINPCCSLRATRGRRLTMLALKPLKTLSNTP